MDTKKASWNSNHNLLRSIFLKPKKFDEAIKLCLEQHSMVHLSKVSQINTVTFEDELWDGMNETAFRAMPSLKDQTVAWCLWHTARIEDITINILVAGDTQVINTDNWHEKMNVKISDTGNAMTNNEVIDFSSNVDMHQLCSYRVAVGKKTREVIQSLQPADLKKKMPPERLQRILDEGAVLNVDGARWLVDFWGRKNVAGILLMPVTRHHLVHINEAMRIKKKSQSSRSKSKP